VQQQGAPLALARRLRLLHLSLALHAGELQGLKLLRLERQLLLCVRQLLLCVRQRLPRVSICTFVPVKQVN
jgi:hypothetical protein